MSETMELEEVDNLQALSDEELDAHLQASPDEGETTEFTASAEPEEPVGDTAEAPESDIDEQDPIQKELAELKKLYGRQTNELGELRKWKQERETQEVEETKLKPDEAMDEFVRDPTEFVRKQQAAAELERRQVAERQRQAYESNLEVVKAVHADFDDIKQDIVDYAKGRGENASLDMVEQLVAVNPSFLTTFIDKMKLEKEVQDLRNIVTGNKTRSTKAAVASKRAVVKGPSSSSQKSVSEDVTDLTSLSDSELEAILKG
jgi:hypothetical protein